MLILVVVLGNISVGKTSIIKRVLGKPFGDLEATVGVEFSEYEVKNIENKVNLSLQVWDTCNDLYLAGAERYRAITTSHIRNADGALLVYDLTDQNSFMSLDYWHDSIRKATTEDIVIYLIGNKDDLEGTKVDEDMKQKACNIFKIIKSYDVSAKLNTGIEEMFQCFYKDIYHMKKDTLLKKSDNFKKLIERRNKSSDTNKRCC